MSWLIRSESGRIGSIVAEGRGADKRERCPNGSYRSVNRPMRAGFPIWQQRSPNCPGARTLAVQGEIEELVEAEMARFAHPKQIGKAVAKGEREPLSSTPSRPRARRASLVIYCFVPVDGCKALSAGCSAE